MRETPHGVLVRATWGGCDIAVDLKRYRFTRSDYHRMGQTGIIRPGARVELIDGEIIEMSPLAFPTLTVAVDAILG